MSHHPERAKGRLAMQCTATKRDGARCRLPVTGSNGLLCWAHDEANAEERRRTAARGGRGKAARKIGELHADVEAVIADVKTERLSPAQGQALKGLYGVLIALERLHIERDELEIAQRRLELDVEERTQLKRQVEELEAAAAAQNGRRGAWG